MKAFTHQKNTSFFVPLLLCRVLVTAAVLITSAVIFAQNATAQGQGSEAAEMSLPPKEKFHLFLLTGQSNMAGRGRLDAAARKPHPRVLMFNREGKWVPAIDPLHFDKPGIVGVGLGRSFAEVIAAEDPEITIGLIPCAVGGSPIAAWEPGGYHPSTKTHPWDDAMKRAKAALPSGTLRGILWHQGESDAKDGLSQAYEKKLHQLIARFRGELKTDAPFIAGQMGQFVERRWDEHRIRVDRAHRKLQDRVPRTAFVDSDGLSHKGDEVHFDTPSYRELGRRYAAAYLHLRSSDSADADALGNPLRYRMERTVAHQGFDGKMCWVHARAGSLPAQSWDQDPTVIMTMQKLLLTGSDVFYALNQTTWDGKKWSTPVELSPFSRQSLGENREMTVCDFTPKWHFASGTMLGTGHTVVYENNRVMHVRPRATAYATFDPASNQWTKWKTLGMPNEPRFQNAGAGSVQRLDLDNGDVLLPIYFKEPTAKQYSTTVLRCRFDGETLTYIEHGSELTVPVKRGLYEPSITRYAGRFYLTMRNDDHGYVASSDDGLNYSKPQQWTFDDGSDLGNYNTQQHWVTHRKGLFLVYTRRGADNDHVFRHRAPLFMAQVDPVSLRVLRETERIVVEEKGARLGNFGIVDVAPDQTWITVTEWMQPLGVEKHGSDNRVHVVKLHWSHLNHWPASTSEATGSTDQ